MAEDTLTTIQYGLMLQEQKIVDLTTKFYKEPIAGLLKDGNKVTTLKQGGRTLTRYFNDTLYRQAGSTLSLKAATTRRPSPNRRRRRASPCSSTR